MRNISFHLTYNQVKNTFESLERGNLQVHKDITRRLGWGNLKVGEKLWACKKCQGRKPGEPLERLGIIEVVSLTSETLAAITAAEVAREGFQDQTPAWFVAMFCQSMQVTPRQQVYRLEFKYLLSWHQARILLHTLGLDHAKRPYRNYYTAPQGDQELQRLVELGYLERVPMTSRSGLVCYAVTAVGAAAVGSNLPQEN